MQTKFTFTQKGTWFKKILAVAIFFALSYQTVKAQYCTVSVANSSEQIGNVTFANVNNTSAFAAGVGYQDFTAQIANVFQGLAYPITVTSVNPFAQDQLLIWIDYNNNNSFLDAGEQVFASGVGPGPYSTTINIPAATPVGAKRMRIRLHDTSDGPNATPCGASDWGQTEDYTVNIQANTPCAGTPIPGNTLSSVATACPGATFNLTLQNTTAGVGVTYQWQSGASATGPWTNIGGATSNAYTATMPATPLFYQCLVTCATNVGTSTPLQVAQTPPSGCYCTPAVVNCAASDVITRVTFAGINNTSACAAGGYTNYTTSVAAGTPFIGASNPIAVTVGPGGTEHVGVWIDYNKNGTFEATEFTYLGSANGATINSAIVVPATAQLGPTRMRVRVRWATILTGADACAITGFGEVEDYTVNIIPCVPVAITTQPANASAVCGSTATFTTTATGSIPSYIWQYRTSATGAWINVPNMPPYSNVTTASLTVATSTALNGYQFRGAVAGACTGVDFTSAATLTVNQLLAVVTPTAQSICAGSNAIVPISIGNTSGTATTTFSSAANLALAIPENGTGVNNVINIATLPASSQITDVKVRFNITHTWGGDLIMALKAPNGQVFNLSYALNGTDNPGTFTNTVVSLNPLSPLGVAYPLLSTAGATPFTNTYKADGRTAATASPLDDGSGGAPIPRPTGPTGFTATTSIPADIYGLVGSGNGAWTLALYDFYNDGANGGIINRLVNWSMDLTYGSLASGVFTSTPATPNTIFTDAAATVAYTGTPINTVYVKPTATTSYNVAINTGLCTTSANVLVTVNAGPTGTLSVAPVAACVGKNAVFSYTGLTGGTGLTHQWQVSTTAVPTFTNIAGATSASYTTAAATAAMSGNKYRVIVGAMGCMATSSLTSADAILTVNPNPVVTISAAPITKLFPGLTSTLTASVTPNAVGATYQWTRNGANVAGATANKYVVNIDGLGSYTVKVIDVNGCTTAATIPESIAISDSANKETLFIYPSPNTGKFQVRYYNDISDTRNAPGAVNIYDEKGSRVFTRTYSPGLGYGSMQVDLGTHGSGVYRVDLINPKGERIKTGSVMVF